ncbi:M4 family metallopeptidase [Thalassotalea piscium]|uniref:Vibriolysin n=1 Tax=Thalassotalea piscium TaxID=1230533 RepID=A0A7X0TT83_9GAMM|nr:M4 family metallopeptidase [Thalassotalea piscium]MBB6542820.1 vibriolysin [Thalassotalea piscium]
MRNNYIKYIVAASLGALSINAAYASDVKIEVATENGTPSFIKGDLGKINAAPTSASVLGLLKANSQYALNGNEAFSVKEQWIDKLGKQHLRLNQTINGLPVYGTSLTVHSSVKLGGLKSSVEKNDVYAITGTVASAKSESKRKLIASSATGDAKRVKQLAAGFGNVISEPTKVYVYLPVKEETILAWKVEVEWNNGGDDFGRDILFYDANSLAFATRHAQVHSAKSWKTYDLQNRTQNYAPGVLRCTNNQYCGDSSAQRAHDGAAIVYDYYLDRFNRDSINNNGLTMVSSVHLGNNVANAYWTGSQMMYGDGDGQMLSDLTLSFDVIGHELTHGVTQYTAGLIYNNASGALNEAWSDILGVASKAYRDGTTQGDWYLAEESYTPYTSGDAMRYMHNPTQDNYSRDWYPDRIPFTSNPNGSNDQGGVHGNSGIANLAFVLLSDGGKHPRNKSNAQVPAIGLLKAEQIFYRALTTYMNQSTNFFGARSATAQAAQDLYGSAEKTAVETAWCAVGVGECPDTTPGPVTGQELENGVAVTGISAAAKVETFFTLDVPAGATNLVFNTTGGSGDADLFVKFGSAPTTGSYDCSSRTSSSNETCSISNIQAGTYHVMVQAWNQISGVSLTGSFDSGSGGNLDPISVSASNISVSAGNWARYTYVMPAGYSSMTIATSGGTGDVDLYVNFGSQSTSSTYDCRPYRNGNNESCTFQNPSSGTWYLDIYGYNSASGVTLSLEANP